jgi:aminopeptidase N
MAPYLALFAVGEYERIEAQSPGGIPLRHYVHPDLRAAFEAQAGLTGEALDWMANLLGPYPFEAFGFVTTRLVSFASETQTMVILPETSLNEETIVHELAHMWLGDWVSLDSWGDMWLKEGLAIYLSLVWQTRQEPAGLDIFMQARTASVLEKASPYPLNNLPRSQLLGYDTYWRGAALIHALRQQVGDQAFFNGLRQIVAQYGGGTLSQAQFRQVMEESSGLSLEAFFAEWLP